MKRISFFLVALLWATPVVLQAQDAAIEERLNKLSAQIQDLADARDAQNKRIDELARQVRALQDQSGKAGAGYATQEDLKQLTTQLQEIDEKRKHDSGQGL
jgi:septal ring factor EnvC (AmiA/AmiB activator)